MKRVITLITDFGTQDAYVGIMKGVILSINPEVQIVDITHEIEPGDIYTAAFLLKDAYSFFPKGTIHVAVIDPGVGGERRAIAVRIKDYFFVGPDNGLFWPIISENKDALVIHLTNKKYFLPDISTTFHGRDIFAPVAAYISKGVEITDMGVLIDDPVRIELKKAVFERDKIIGQAIRTDRFGNIITNISKEDLLHFFGDTSQLEVYIDGIKIPNISRCYSEVDLGEFLALIGSSGLLEISVNMGNAFKLLNKELKNIKIEVRKAKSSSP